MASQLIFNTQQNRNFNKKSMKKITPLLIACVVLFSCSEQAKKETSGVTINGKPKKEEPHAKTDAEIYAEGGKELVSLAKEGMENRHERKLIALGARDAIWAYQIGIQYDNETTLFKDFEKLKTITGISIFKNPSNGYLIIKKGNSEEELKMDYSSFKSQVDSLGVLSNIVGPINLATRCRKGIENDFIKHKRKKYDCIACK